MTNESIYYPISDLPMIRLLIDGPLEEAKTLYADLFSAKDKPHVLDKQTLDWAIDLYEREHEMDSYFKEQLWRWKNDNPDKETAKELLRLEQARRLYSELGSSIISLSKELRKGCIDSILDMDDAELGLNFLMGHLKL